MKLFTGIALILLVQLCTPQEAIADNSTLAKTALESQAARFKAMINVDLASLDKLLSEDLSYSHTTGWTESKSAFMSTVKSGNINYMSVTPRDLDVRVYADVAVITGLSNLQGVVGDKPINITIRFLDVSRRVGNSWQLVAWQSVKVSDN